MSEVLTHPADLDQLAVDAQFDQMTADFSIDPGLLDQGMAHFNAMNQFESLSADALRGREADAANAIAEISLNTETLAMNSLQMAAEMHWHQNNVIMGFLDAENADTKGSNRKKYGLAA